MPTVEVFDITCRQCPRLAEYLATIKQQYPSYHAQPVAPFGANQIQLLIVGLAPGLHGANASGRPFTGDYAGLLLYQTLYKYGFSNAPVSNALNDGLELSRCRITNAVKCVPPQNKPLPSEIAHCNHYLSAELHALPERAVILALGQIAHQSVLKGFAIKQKQAVFKHNSQHELPGGRILVDSYHTSRYNMQTGRLTEAMFQHVFDHITALLAENS